MGFGTVIKTHTGIDNAWSRWSQSFVL